MLIQSSRHTKRDLATWAIHEREDAIRAQDPRLARKEREALDTLSAFVSPERTAADGAAYAGVSWGKDSTVLAHLVARLHEERGVTVPLVWIVVQPMCNPDCALVRGAFLAAHGSHVSYSEIVVTCEQDPATGEFAGTGRLEQGFRLAVEKIGPRHVSGVRGDESGRRRIRMALWGTSTRNTCAPIGWWSASDVYAYLHKHALPVHPAYACSQGGLWPREKLRVASIGGERGSGFGRREWEWCYYREELLALGLDGTSQTR